MTTMRDRMSRRSAMGASMAAFALAFSALGACAGFAPLLVAPKVSVETIAVGGVRAGDAVVTLSLRVENPNAIDLSLQSLRFSLSVNELALTTGTTVEGKTIAAGGSAVIDVQTHTDINAVLQLITMSANHRVPSLQYALDGEAIVQGGIRLPFARRGDIPLPSTPPPASTR
jgi:LEA14-like dessication related protein